MDIFFVLSGYLITSILLSEYVKNNDINFIRFYLRRILRLFPALCLLLVIYGGLAAIASPNPTRHFIDIGIVFFYLANWTLAMGTNHPAEMTHAWSLAVEEQFYLIWPALLFWSMRRIRLPGLFWATAILAMVSTLEMTFFANRWSVARLYYASDTRAFPILYGCLLAIVFRLQPEWRLPNKIEIILPYIGWGGLSWLMFRTTSVSQSDYSSDFFFAAVFALCLLYSAVTSTALRTQKLLSWQPLVELGKRSYGLYLWHFLLFELIADQRGLQRTILSIILSLIATEVSYRFLEQPILSMKDRLPKQEKCVIALT